MYTERDCLDIIDSGEMDAEELLMLKLPSIRRRFKHIDKALVTLLADVRKEFPDAQYYTASGGFHLMLGSSHSERQLIGQQQLIALSGRASIGDGDF